MAVVSLRVVNVGLSPATSATLILCCQRLAGNSKETASDKLEEGGDDVKSSWPLRPGLHTCYNGAYKEKRLARASGPHKVRRSPDWSLQLDSMKSDR